MHREAWLQLATKLFVEKHIDAPKLSAELLLCFVLNIDRTQLRSRPSEDIPNTALPALANLMERRGEGEPIAYITKRKEFFSREFYVNRSVLIPRPETELLIEFALNKLPSTRINFLDAGAGSGCISITLCAENPLWKGIALDISNDALKVAKYNAQRHNVDTNITFVQADFASTAVNESSLDLYVANPPYIGEEEYLNLSHEILCFEPKTALVPQSYPANKSTSNILGVEDFEDILYQAEKSLKTEGLLLIEHGATQQNILKTMLLKNNIWENVESHKDLSGYPRFISAYKGKGSAEKSG